MVFYAFKPDHSAPSASEIATQNRIHVDEQKKAAAAEAEKNRVPTALFIGDSYSAGTGASTKAKRWTSLVSSEMGWQEVNKALGGTGFVSTSGKSGCGRELCENYIDNFKSFKTSYFSPDFVVIAGGQNDNGKYVQDPSKIQKAIKKLYKTVHVAYPSAKIISVGPSTTGVINESVISMDATVQAAAKSVDAQYVSLINPNVTKKSMILEDGAHVNDSGHAAIAERVLDSLQK